MLLGVAEDGRGSVWSGFLHLDERKRLLGLSYVEDVELGAVAVGEVGGVREGRLGANRIVGRGEGAADGDHGDDRSTEDRGM